MGTDQSNAGCTGVANGGTRGAAPRVRRTCAATGNLGASLRSMSTVPCEACHRSAQVRRPSVVGTVLSRRRAAPGAPRRAFSAQRLVTTPIFYVNASPHLGHVHSAVLADAMARWLTLAGRQPPGSPAAVDGAQQHAEGAVGLLTTGTDEHGIKVRDAARQGSTGAADGVLCRRYKKLLSGQACTRSSFATASARSSVRRLT